MSSCDVTEQAANGAQDSAPPLIFEFLAFRFQFIARDSVYFPPGKSGNIVRGAFGSLFRQLVCIEDCHDSKTCENRASCVYARIFEPIAETGGPSGLHDWPRPFVFRAAHLDGRTIEAGRPFQFDVHLFDLKDPTMVVHFVLAFAEVARQGIGPRRGRAQLAQVDQLDAADRPAARVYNGTNFLATDLQPPISLDLAGTSEAGVSKVIVRFITPTELKHGQLLATRPEFPVLFGRIRDRISTLRALYGPGALDVDFKELGERASQVKMARLNLDFSEAERRSAKTGQRHPLGGFVGEAEYEGALGEFMPWLRAAHWVGVGRQTVWGKGVIDTKVLAQ